MVSVLFYKKKKKDSGCHGLTSYFLKVRDIPKILNEGEAGGEKEVIQV